TAQVDDVEIAAPVFAERRWKGQRSDVGYDLRGSVGCDPCAAVEAEREDLSKYEVGEEILTLQRVAIAAIDVTARDRMSDAVIIKIDRRDHRPGADGVCGVGRPGVELRTLEMIPAVVCALLADVDLFPHALAHVGDVEGARRAVEARPPRVAQAQRKDL